MVNGNVKQNKGAQSECRQRLQQISLWWPKVTNIGSLEEAVSYVYTHNKHTHTCAQIMSTAPTVICIRPHRDVFLESPVTIGEKALSALRMLTLPRREEK